MNSNIHKISKDKKMNKLWRKLFDQHKVEFKIYVYLREKEEYNKWNVLHKIGSGFCTADSFLDTLAHFRFMIFTQGRISTHVDLFP